MIRVSDKTDTKHKIIILIEKFIQINCVFVEQ